MSRSDDTPGLYAEVRPVLLRYLTRLTGDADAAEDFVQEAFVRLAERPPGDDRNIKGWLFTVATNLARDGLRTSRRRLVLVRGVGDRVSADPPRDPSSGVERAELRARVRRALEGLSERERTALLMREEGFSHREIAEAVDTTTQSVGTLLARALKKMAQRLSSEEAAS
ncbi:MAG TPA: sigma-70 family RNA polymerase sigma factor [Gemmatimonadales bacterium]